MCKKIENTKLSTEFVNELIGLFDTKGKGCNDATIVERLEDTIESVVQAGIDCELSYGRDDIININPKYISPHRFSKFEQAKSQNDIQTDGYLCQTSVDYQQELHEVVRKITLLFTDGMDIREISEYIQALFDLDAQEHFADSGNVSN